jgi:hypothetical protein
MSQVFITKYALTQGILEVNADVSEQREMISWKADGSWCTQFAHKGDFHFTRESAVEKAEQMRLKRIKSLNVSIAKLEKLSFS